MMDVTIARKWQFKNDCHIVFLLFSSARTAEAQRRQRVIALQCFRDRFGAFDSQIVI
jgi:hypothetical protein